MAKRGFKVMDSDLHVIEYDVAARIVNGPVSIIYAAEAAIYRGLVAARQFKAQGALGFTKGLAARVSKVLSPYPLAVFTPR